MTLKELIKQELLNAGVQVATAVRITIDGAETLVIASYSDPALDREVGDGSGVELALLQSARAGFSNGIVARQRRERLILEPEAFAGLTKNSENDLLEV